MDRPRLVQGDVEAAGRTFHVAALCFGNGSFVSVSEGGARLGALVASLGSGPAPVTASVIPAMSDQLFMRLTAERISSAGRGIAVVSCSSRGEIGPEAGRALMAEIAEMVRGA